MASPVESVTQKDNAVDATSSSDKTLLEPNMEEPAGRGSDWVIKYNILMIQCVLHQVLDFIPLK